MEKHSLITLIIKKIVMKQEMVIVIVIIIMSIGFRDGNLRVNV